MPKPRPEVSKQRALVGFIATLISIVGSLLMAFAYFGIREAMPTQAASPVTTASFLADPPVATHRKLSEIKALVAKGAAKPKIRNPHSGVAGIIGTVSFPSLKMSWPIYQGTDDASLAKGVGHYLKSVMPGQPDNSVLAGHRETVFNRLGELKVGQNIFVSTTEGVFKYKIRKFRIVERSDRTVIVPTPKAVLTLVTCYPFNYFGITHKTFVVVADLIDRNLTIH